MNVKKAARVLIPYAVVVAVVAVVFAFALPKAQYYAGGELIDASQPGGIISEEDGDPWELGCRLVRLAVGDDFTEDQIRQVACLIGGLFEDIRYMSMDIEKLQGQVKQLREQAQQE